MKNFKRVFSLLFVLCMLLTMSLTVFATDTATGDADAALATIIKRGYVSTSQSVANKTYKLSGGGSVSYNELVDNNGLVGSDFTLLTVNSKQELLADMMSCANFAVESDSIVQGANTSIVEEDTKSNWMGSLQRCDGIGSQLLAVILEGTKPDFVGGNKIWMPFASPFGIAMGFIVIATMALLGVSVALDIAYIVVSPFRIFFDNKSDNGEKGGAYSLIISSHARSAVAEAEDNNSGGTRKLALSIWGKTQGKQYIVLGICVLYLVSGKMWVLVAWFLDLLSGFMGF